MTTAISASRRRRVCGRRSTPEISGGSRAAGSTITRAISPSRWTPGASQAGSRRVPSMGVDETSLERIRNATFPSARRGYDKHEVEKFLGRLADWLETGGGGEESRSDAVRKELERVGERTGAILSQAEESAQQIRAEAEEEARGTVNSANIQAGETRAEAENYADETRASADRDAKEALDAAQAKARRIIDDANQRREDMEA